VRAPEPEEAAEPVAEAEPERDEEDVVADAFAEEPEVAVPEELDEPVTEAHEAEAAQPEIAQSAVAEAEAAQPEIAESEVAEPEPAEAVEEEPLDDEALAFDFLGGDEVDEDADVESLLRDVEELAADQADEEFPFEELRARLMSSETSEEATVAEHQETPEPTAADALAIDEELTGDIKDDPTLSDDELTVGAPTVEQEDAPAEPVATEDTLSEEPASSPPTAAKADEDDLAASASETTAAEEQTAPSATASSGAGWLVEPSLSAPKSGKASATNHAEEPPEDASGGNEKKASDEIEKIRRILNDLE
jgi:hypothetical protein